MSIRYASLQCNTRGRWGPRLTPVPTSRVSDTPRSGRAHPRLRVPSVPASTRLSCTPMVAPVVRQALRSPSHAYHPSCTCQAWRLHAAPQGAPQRCAPLAARGGRRHGQPLCGLPPAHAALPRHRFPGTGSVCLVMRRGAGRETLRGLRRNPAWFGEKPCVVWGEALRGLGRSPAWFGEKPCVVWGEALRGLGRADMT